MTWTVVISEKDDGTVSFLYDGKVDRYKLIGLMEVEIDMMRKELIQNMMKGGDK